MKLYCVSDAHLKFQEDMEAKKRRLRLMSFLESIKDDADIIVFNGDIFDLWFCWEKTIIRGYFSFLVLLKELHNKGIKMIFIAGNHDFWFKGFFSEEFGMEVYKDDYQCEIDGKKLFFSHGDVYTKNDLRYKFFRSLIRNPIIMTGFSIIHPHIGLWIGNKMSRSSRKRVVPKHVYKDKEQGLINYAKAKTEEFDYVIMGHTHTPKKIDFESGSYLNSGDWIKNNTYIKITNGEANVFTFTMEEK